MSAPARLVVLFAGLAACTEANPLDLDPHDDDTGAAGSAVGSAATQPAFEPHDPAPPATGGGPAGGAPVPPAGSGGAAAGPGGPAAGTGGTATGTGGSAAAGTGGSAGAAAGRAGGPPSAIQLIEGLEPVALDNAGVVVAGHRAGRAVRWTAMTGPIDLPFARANHTISVPTAISGDGMVIVGSSRTASRSEAVIWIGPANAQGLGFALAGHDSSEAVAVSSDGKTIAGTSESSAGPFGARERAFVWRAGDVALTPLPTLPGDSGSVALAMSRDGAAVAGISYDIMSNPPRQRAFCWTEKSGTREIEPADGAALMVPKVVGVGGSVVFGDALFGPLAFPGVSDAESHAFRWTLGGGSQLITPSPGRPQSSVNMGDDSGTLAVGTAFGGTSVMTTQSLPFQWNSFGQVQTLLPSFGFDDASSVVVDAQGIMTAGIAFGGIILWIKGAPGMVVPFEPFPFSSEAVAVSAVGHKLLGRGISLNGGRLAWLASLP